MDLRGAPNENICHADSQGRERAELTIQFPGGDLDTGDGYLLGCFSDRCHPFATRLPPVCNSAAPLMPRSTVSMVTEKRIPEVLSSLPGSTELKANPAAGQPGHSTDSRPWLS